MPIDRLVLGLRPGARGGDPRTADAPRPARAGVAAAPRPRSTIAVSYDRLVNAMLFVCIASGSIAFIEPSPYDLLAILLLSVWFVGGFTVHPFVLTFAALIGLYNLGGFLALLPYLNETDPTTFMVQSLYLAFSAVFFALFFAQNTVARADVCLRAYALGTVFAALCGIAGYFNLGGTADLFTLYGRASGPFKDPNVYGSYLILGALFLIQTLILGRARHVVLTVAGLLIVTAGVFLSFSRGSWGALVCSALLVVASAFATTNDARIRRRIVVVSLLAIGLAVLSLLVLLSMESVRALFLERFALAQDYDTGQTGRFGNQLRAIPMLLERLNGFGPVRFRLIFDLDSHNSYLGSFASYGWLGGASFFLLTGLTTYIGFRQLFATSPFQRAAQVFWPGLFVLLVQGFQIDIDHWRHVYLMLGAVWGLETARIKWVERQGRAPAFPAAQDPVAAA